MDKMQEVDQSTIFRSILRAHKSCRLAEEEILKHITTTDSSVQRPTALEMLCSWYVNYPRGNWRPVPRSSSPSPHPGHPGSSQAEGVQLDLGR